MSLRRGLLRFAMLAACCLAVLLSQSVGPALAQAINLTAANVGTLRNGGARLTLTFSSGVPKYQVYGDGTAQVTVMLFGTTPATNAPTGIPAIGPVAAGQITSVGSTTTVVLYGRYPSGVHVATGAGQTLIVDLVPVRAATPGTATQPSPPPAATVPAPGFNIKVVQLKYADVSEIVGILSGTSITPTSTFQPQPNAGNFGSPSSLGAGGSNAVAGFGTTSSPTVNYATTNASGGESESIGQRVNEHIAVDRRLNALIFTGTPAEIAGYEALVNAVDIPLRSVMLQTEIVELTDTAARNVGIDFTNGAGTGQIASATFTTPNPNTGLNNGSANQVSLQAAIYAQVIKGNGRIIATPRILALDGRPASILTGDALPIITSIAVSGVNAVQQQVEYVNVGVNLQIEARSTDDGHVTAQVFSAVSSVTGYTSSYPNIAQRQASTTVTVKDGQPFVLGGLLEKNELNSMSKFPILGDLPIIGGLFRVRHDTSSTDNLYIVVTPQIIQPDGASASIKPVKTHEN
jgi:general secretion pathway protein D